MSHKKKSKLKSLSLEDQLISRIDKGTDSVKAFIDDYLRKGPEALESLIIVFAQIKATRHSKLFNNGKSSMVLWHEQFVNLLEAYFKKNCEKTGDLSDKIIINRFDTQTDKVLSVLEISHDHPFYSNSNTPERKYPDEGLNRNIDFLLEHARSITTSKQNRSLSLNARQALLKIVVQTSALLRGSTVYTHTLPCSEETFAQEQAKTLIHEHKQSVGGVASVLSKKLRINELKGCNSLDSMLCTIAPGKNIHLLKNLTFSEYIIVAIAAHFKINFDPRDKHYSDFIQEAKGLINATKNYQDSLSQSSLTTILNWFSSWIYPSKDISADLDMLNKYFMVDQVSLPQSISKFIASLEHGKLYLLSLRLQLLGEAVTSLQEKKLLSQCDESWKKIKSLLNGNNILPTLSSQDLASKLEQGIKAKFSNKGELQQIAVMDTNDIFEPANKHRLDELVALSVSLVDTLIADKKHSVASLMRSQDAITQIKFFPQLVKTLAYYNDFAILTTTDFHDNTQRLLENNLNQYLGVIKSLKATGEQNVSIKTQIIQSLVMMFDSVEKLIENALSVDLPDKAREYIPFLKDIVGEFKLIAPESDVSVYLSNNYKRIEYTGNHKQGCQVLSEYHFAPLKRYSTNALRKQIRKIEVDISNKKRALKNKASREKYEAQNTLSQGADYSQDVYNPERRRKRARRRKKKPINESADTSSNVHGKAAEPGQDATNVAKKAVVQQHDAILTQPALDIAPPNKPAAPVVVSSAKSFAQAVTGLGNSHKSLAGQQIAVPAQSPVQEDETLGSSIIAPKPLMGKGNHSQGKNETSDMTEEKRDERIEHIENPESIGSPQVSPDINEERSRQVPQVLGSQSADDNRNHNRSRGKRRQRKKNNRNRGNRSFCSPNNTGMHSFSFYPTSNNFNQSVYLPFRSMQYTPAPFIPMPSSQQNARTLTRQWQPPQNQLKNFDQLNLAGKVNECIALCRKCLAQQDLSGSLSKTHISNLVVILKHFSKSMVSSNELSHESKGLIEDAHKALGSDRRDVNVGFQELFKCKAHLKSIQSTLKKIAKENAAKAPVPAPSSPRFKAS